MHPIAKIQEYIRRGDIASAGLIVTKDGREILHTLQGYADIAGKIPVTDRTMFRMMSMTKPVTAVAVMQLAEQGKLDIDDPMEAYLPEFSHRKVPDQPITPQESMQFMLHGDQPEVAAAMKARLEGIHLVDAKRKFTIKDVLTHSAGLGMGPVSGRALENSFTPGDLLADRVRKYAPAPLDFEPGTMTGYSAHVGFDMLGRLVEVVSGETFSRYLTEHIFKPLGIEDLGFELPAEARGRMAVLYKKGPEGLTREAEAEYAPKDPIDGFFSGSAGLIGSLPAYNRFVQMLAGEGSLEGVQILRPETLRRMATDRQGHGLELAPGCEWGLGMLHFGDREKTRRWVQEGAFGWSGAYGTHFYVDPVNRMTLCLAAQRSDIGGAGSPVSLGLEEAVYKTFVLGQQ
mgnify:CR=1 FL=1